MTDYNQHFWEDIKDFLLSFLHIKLILMRTYKGVPEKWVVIPAALFLLLLAGFTINKAALQEDLDRLKSQTQQMVELQEQMTSVRAVLQQLQQKLE